MSNVTLKDVAKKTGVCFQTVSKILNNKAPSLVTEATRKKVIAVARKLNYQPNQFARSLKTGRTNIIGIKGGIGTYFSPYSPYFSHIHTGISNRLIPDKYKFIFHNFDEMDDQGQPSDMAQTWLADGMIFILLSGQIKQFKKRELVFLKKSKFPFAAIHSMRTDLGCYNIGLDCVHGGYRAAEHLLEHGYDSIGIVKVNSKNLVHEDLITGYKKALQEHGMPFDKGYLYESSGFFTDDGYALAEKIINEHRKLPRALFVLGDSLAYGMMAKFEEAGIDVPNDIAIIGFGNEVIQLLVRTKLTTINQPGYEKGYQASELLMNQIKDPGKINTPQFVLLKPETIVRKSCGCK